MHPFLPAVTLLIGWVFGFFCCWKMQVDHRKITDAALARAKVEHDKIYRLK